MCGGHRRKPPSEENDEGEEASTAASGGEGGTSQAFMLSDLKPATGKFVLGPPVDTEPPVVVFTGPADHPDVISQTASAAPKKKKRVAAKTDQAGEADKPADKPAAKPVNKKGAKAARPKVSSAKQ
jgi:D-alanyl-D-alanine carboxypeptidase